MDMSTKIAEGWKLARIKDIATLFTGNSIKDELKNNYMDSDDSIPYISTRDIDEKYQTINYDNGLYVKKNDKSFKRAPKNSTFLCIEGGSAGKKIAFNDREACFVNKLCCFHSETDGNKFIYYYLMSPLFTETFRSYITGLIGGVSISSLRGFSIILPPLPEQQKIANFLDKECAEIDKLSEDIQKQIEILEDYKKSVITRAVIKGLNPNVEMRESKIDGIGEIPTDWKIGRIKNACKKITDGSHFSPKTTDTGYTYITAANVNNDTVDRTNTKKISPEDFTALQKNGCQPRPYDVLLTKDGSVGRSAVVTNNNDFVVLSSVGILTAAEDINPFFLKYCLDSLALQEQMNCSMAGAALKRIVLTKISNYFIVIPPLIAQNEIVEYLNEKTATINESIKLKQQQLEDLGIYKKSIIYEYVTGKKRVKGAL